MRTNILLAAIFALVFSVSICNTASALEAPAPFTILNIYASNSGNFSFRIYSNNPAQWQCSGGPVNPSWSYLEESDSGSKGKIATIMLAYALGKPVQVYTEKIGNYCHITEVVTQ